VSEVVGDDHVFFFPVVVSFERLATLANQLFFLMFLQNLYSTKKISVVFAKTCIQQKMQWC
jgi:hypothetical protein